MNPETVADLVQRWDRQQAGYIADREARFTVILDALGLAFGDEFTVVDLACGPGSLSRRILDRFPHARVIGVDLDPVLLALARTDLNDFGDRARLLDLDLAQVDWPEQIRATAHGPIHAAVSTTALHWFPADELVTLYARIRGLLTEGGVFLNGDHFRFAPSAGTIHDWAARHDAATQTAAFDSGVDDWDRWWDSVEQVPELAGLMAERGRRFADRPETAPTGIDFQTAVLGQAGFVEHGTLWQLFDDYVVYGVKAR